MNEAQFQALWVFLARCGVALIVGGLVCVALVWWTQRRMPE